MQGKTDAADLIKSTARPALDVLPGDASYRNLDLALDDTKDPTRRLRRVLDGGKKSYDVVALDCPPSTSLVSEGVLRAADVLVVPLIPTPLRTFAQMRELLAESGGKGPAVLAFFSMVDRRKTLHRTTVESLPRDRAEVSPICVPAAQAYTELWSTTQRLL